MPAKIEDHPTVFDDMTEQEQRLYLDYGERLRMLNTKVARVRYMRKNLRNRVWWRRRKTKQP